MTASDFDTAQSDTFQDSAGDDFDRATDALRPTQPLRHPKLRAAAELLENGRFPMAARVLREFLRDHPRDVRALYMAAQALAAVGEHEQAQSLLARCVELAPDFTAARFSWAGELVKSHRPEAAIAQSDELLRSNPGNPLVRAIKARALASVGDHEGAAALWQKLAAEHPTRPENWEQLGIVLGALGQIDESVAAYRRRIELEPSCGAAWWSLADLKTFRFDASDIDRMEAQLPRTDLASADRIYLHFALGKAYADLKLFEKSFANYARGNALCRIEIPHDPEIMTNGVKLCENLFTAEFFNARPAVGCPKPDPIFIVGMQRAGSTLVEQILASHSQIEGTRELHDLEGIRVNLTRSSPAGYPNVLTTLAPAKFRELGEVYLEKTRAYRRLGRPFFTDKMGGNFLHVGLIHLILPRAKIIDVRRHPLSCCVSNFVQIFAIDKLRTSGLTDIGRWYRDYVRLMAHFDSVLPGRVHRVFYEQLVERPEHEIRRLLEFLGLPFEESCLAFHQTERVVTTVSAQQVRKPMTAEGVGRWRSFEPWLGPLKSVLGPVLDKYPDVPAFD